MILKVRDRQFGSVGVFIVMLNVPPVIVVFENKQKDGTLFATKLEFWFDTFCEKAMSTWSGIWVVDDGEGTEGPVLESRFEMFLCWLFVRTL